MYLPAELCVQYLQGMYPYENGHAQNWDEDRLIQLISLASRNRVLAVRENSGKD
jgi:hypothetical protein